MKRTITVFGSAFPKEGEKEFEIAEQLGKILAENNFNVCTGGYNGIMKAVSKGASENGAEAIGVTVESWNRNPNEFVTKEFKSSDIITRITKLVEIGDAFFVLHGGTGTLLEFAYVWEFMNKNLLTIKPIVCYSTMWKKISDVINEQLKREKRSIDLVKYYDNFEGAVNYLKKELQ